MRNKKVKLKIILGIIVCSLFSACAASTSTNSNNASKANANAKDSDVRRQKERTDLFASFQKYVDENYPNWKVKGIRKEDSDETESGEKQLYYLLLNDGKTNKILIIIGASFELSDGAKTTHFFEPNKQMGKNLRDKKLKESANQEGRDDLMAEIEMDSYEKSELDGNPYER